MNQTRFFEKISDQIIQANFDHQKQYDLLRIHQRIENISSLILLNSTRLLITQHIKATLPNELTALFQKIGPSILEMHKAYTIALKNTQKTKKKSFNPFIK